MGIKNGENTAKGGGGRRQGASGESKASVVGWQAATPIIPKFKRALVTMSSHGLLLRLFQSPGFFSVLRALQYIRIYSDNIGITHYLTRRLSQLPAHELADKWMLVWLVLSILCTICSDDYSSHLLVTRPSASTALESLVLKKAEESTLIALLVGMGFDLCYI